MILNIDKTMDIAFWNKLQPGKETPYEFTNVEHYSLYMEHARIMTKLRHVIGAMGELNLVAHLKRL